MAVNQITSSIYDDIISRPQKQVFCTQENYIILVCVCVWGISVCEGMCICGGMCWCAPGGANNSIFIYKIFIVCVFELS